MGGTVAVTLRKPDGAEYRMDRWTNSMPWGICNLKMLQSDEAHITEYLKPWLDMQDDWERNKESGVFENNMTSCYFPSMGLVPCGYGLVVVDHINKVILDMQGYSGLDNIAPVSLSLELPRKMPEDGVFTFDPDGSVVRFKEFLDAGLVKGIKTKDSFDKLDMTFDQLVVKLMDWENTRDWYKFDLDLNGWSYESFGEYDPVAMKAMRNRILELGFVISDEENKAWDALIKEYEEEYDE